MHAEGPQLGGSDPWPVACGRPVLASDTMSRWQWPLEHLQLLHLYCTCLPTQPVCLPSYTALSCGILCHNIVCYRLGCHTRRALSAALSNITRDWAQSKCNSRQVAFTSSLSTRCAKLKLTRGLALVARRAKDTNSQMFDCQHDRLPEQMIHSQDLNLKSQMCYTCQEVTCCRHTVANGNCRAKATFGLAIDAGDMRMPHKRVQQCCPQPLQHMGALTYFSAHFPCKNVHHQHTHIAHHTHSHHKAWYTITAGQHSTSAEAQPTYNACYSQHTRCVMMCAHRHSKLMWRKMVAHTYSPDITQHRAIVKV